MEIEYPDLGALDRKETIGDWLDSGRLRAIDWSEVKSRATVGTDEDGRPFASLRPAVGEE
jgi:hypothetical protein